MADEAINSITAPVAAVSSIPDTPKFTPRSSADFELSSEATNARKSLHPTNYSHSADMSEVMNEIRSMRGMLEGQLAELSWSNTQKRQPQKVEVLKEMLAAGFSASLSRYLVDKMPEADLGNNGMAWIKSILANNLSTISNESEILEKGGVYVLANIRGGGEFGPKWHQDGMKEKRQNVFDDLYAVSEDLITKKVTSPTHLGIFGGSNGGLLVGVAFTQRPDLYNAVVCQVPLLDMRRYNKLLAGASWMGEYGNPDIPQEWEYIKKYSPYQNLRSGIKYPEVFFQTSTRDDRVHPGHARKMVAKMNDMGYKTYYYENTEGGHAGSSTNEQSAKANALVFSYLLMKLK